MTTPRLRGIMALNLVVAAAGSIVVVNTVNYVRDELGGTQSDVAWMLAASGTGTLVTALLLPRVLDRTAERTVMTAGFRCPGRQRRRGSSPRRGRCVHVDAHCRSVGARRRRDGHDRHSDWKGASALRRPRRYTGGIRRPVLPVTPRLACHLSDRRMGWFERGICGHLEHPCCACRSGNRCRICTLASGDSC